MDAQETCPIPEHPRLAEWAKALNEAGQWAEILDSESRVVYMTDDARLVFGGGAGLAPVPLGLFSYGTEAIDMRMQWRGGQFTLQMIRQSFATYGPWTLAQMPGGAEELRDAVDPRLADLVDQLSPVDPRPVRTVSFRGIYSGAGTGVDILSTAIEVREDDGQFVGTVLISKPAVGMAVLTRITAMGDMRHFERMGRVARPGRRSAAILFADLESSSALSRRLSTASYFSLGRRMVRAADQCVIDAEGLVGRHVGDGVVAFFLAETAGSESAAARSCIEAARGIRQAMVAVAARSDLSAEDLVMRFGLHWGSTLYAGQITTSGRAEVTALGDEVNEAARIEACASGGLALASKALIERLEPEDAAALDLDPDRITYSPLADLPSATEKARRDAPAIAVCEV